MDGNAPTKDPETEKPDLTFRRFEDGDNSPPEWEDHVIISGESHQCPTYVHKSPPCQGSCPSGHDIRGWLAIARGMEKSPVEGMAWQEYAFQRMIQANPFPSVMGRVCPAPCETGCNRVEVDDFVGINAVEQYVGDWAMENNTPLAQAGEDTGKNVAVIGGGPAGLTAAYSLRKKGHGVTIFETHNELGGMMRFGIPGYRTPREMLDTEINRIIDLGVEVKLETTVGKDVSMEDLEKDFDAVFWAIGAQNGRPLPVPGFDAENCITGVDFLEVFNKGLLKAVTKRVVVIGGGDTSIDVASVARRLGHISHNKDIALPEHVVHGYTAQDVVGTMKRDGVEAMLTSLFPIEQMTAAEREREDAKIEGVDLRGSVMPLEVIKDDNGRAVALKMCECDMDGMKPIPREGTEFEIECDLIVSAIGQMGDFTGIEDMDNGKGFIDADQVYQVKGRENHFAGGDILKPHLLTTAIGQGSIAADSINTYLAGRELKDRPKVDVHHFSLLDELRLHDKAPESVESPTSGTAESNFAVHNYEDRSSREIVSHSELYLGHFPFDARDKRTEHHIHGDDVLGNFEERIEGLTEEQAIHEGTRCMSCGMCFECDNCVIYCPQDAIFRVKKDDRTVGRYVDTDYTKCVGCHICMDVCPTGYIKMGLGE
ncbi:MAG: NAD(P)-binding protein [Proteobacteria bacterium]|nr:NAD(P)-binding protein [Pseudomonadota bacterium]MDA1021854.1 NAD(P)-binding protein [Pseudomonadota bacterium]